MASQSRHRIADIHNVVVAHMPDYQIDSVVQVGEDLENLAYEVNAAYHLETPAALSRHWRP